MKSFKTFIKENAPPFIPNIVWHFTSSKVENKIREGGFKTGEELGVGEQSGAVFATQIDTGYNYNRHGGRTVKIGIDIDKMKILDTDDMTSEQKYNLRLDIERYGLIPDGYDAVVFYESGKKHRIWEIAIKPDIATKYIVKK
jgi:hypothetical protein